MCQGQVTSSISAARLCSLSVANTSSVTLDGGTLRTICCCIYSLLCFYQCALLVHVLKHYVRGILSVTWHSTLHVGAMITLRYENFMWLFYLSIALQHYSLWQALTNQEQNTWLLSESATAGYVFTTPPPPSCIHWFHANCNPWKAEHNVHCI